MNGVARSSTLRSDNEERPIAVLIVDDSAVARAAMSNMIASSVDLVLAAAVEGAAQAIAWLGKHRVDVVLLDLEMPGIGGIAALPDLIEAGRGAHVLIVSSAARDGAEATIKALALGAADTLTKPVPGQLNQNFGKLLIDRVQRLGRAVVSKGPVEHLRLRSLGTSAVDLLAIGASTGGINALAQFFANLPNSFAAPILVTQHLPPPFMGYFADQVAAMAGRFTRVAKQGDALMAGEILVAPGHAHLTVAFEGNVRTVMLSTDPAPTRCCPSVDPMFASVAAAAGAGAVAVVLSGMGRDGETGARQIITAGGSVIAQDSATSAVWGMPGTVVRAGLASMAATPAQLAEHIARRGSL